ncbi:hypothetical protein C9374_002395 [Naegleria lovaniensis]|uniref:Mitochondrial carrier protein n=1 Tax=Naegleria lovaniensis TaxID=51637 RepID=A0AA88KMM1_NAELO|nr:uncharacterized protein C9374_002395 [Naegleria lovaniensis]KAG2386651.1 hypothetical protein C9374_002395 [Naegleria lovaniensis]
MSSQTGASSPSVSSSSNVAAAVNLNESKMTSLQAPPKQDNTKSFLVQSSPIVSFISGAVYGCTSVAVGQPLDTIKTIMQSTSTINQHNATTLGVIKSIYNKHGFWGFYRGSLPPLVTASILRSLQFGGYAMALSYIMDHHLMSNNDFRKENLNVLEEKRFVLHPEMFVAGCFGGAARAIVETPVEYLKVRRQTDQPWKLLEVYRGFTATLLRNMFLLGTFFVFVDFFTQEYRNLQVRQQLASLKSDEEREQAKGSHFEFKKLSPFFTGGVCATLAWWLVFPLDVIKSQIQSMRPDEKLGVFQRLSIVGKTLGVRGFFRGIVPASMRSSLANGVSMIAFAYVSSYLNQWDKK